MNGDRPFNEFDRASPKWLFSEPVNALGSNTAATLQSCLENCVEDAPRKSRPR